jgi:hypothetical protein
MDMTSREVLEREIAQLEAQLEPRKRALAALIKLEAITNHIPDTPATRYFNVRPIDAIQEVLKAHGKPMPLGDLVKTLLDGGIAIGKKRAVVNVEVSIRLNVKSGNLTQSKGNLIGLPEWK